MILTVSYLLLALCFASPLAALTAPQNPLMSSSSPTGLRFLSYNVRYDVMPDKISVNESLSKLPKGVPKAPSPYYDDLSEQPWSIRRHYIANDILFNDVDVYGGQELLKRQVDDLAELLGDEYAWIGVGRDDGKKAGEYAAIFYKKSKVRVLSWDTIWLTSTPFSPSRHPDAGSYRVATTAELETLSSRPKSFTLINTHLDDSSLPQRRLGASLLLHRAKYEAIKTKRPVFLTGDFNSPPSDKAYQIITGASVPDSDLNKKFLEKFHWSKQEAKKWEGFKLKDLSGEVEAGRLSGQYATFTGFVELGETKEFKRLDYVFGAGHGLWRAERYRVGENLGDDGVWHSDHRPVFADVVLE